MRAATTTAVTFSRIPPRRSTSRAATWWGRAWVRAVEESSYADSDLHAARQLSRSGAIGSLTVDRGSVVAQVHHRADLWQVQASVPVLDPVSRRAFVELVAAESGHLAGLVAGELPHRLVEQAEEAGVELLPYGGELGASCGCAAWVDPCVHALAVMLQVAWLVDGDPWVLLRLRGLTPHDLQDEPAEGETGRDTGPVTRADAQADAQADGGASPPDDLAVTASPDDLALAFDAAARAARVLALADDPSADIGHLV